jgi:hypothetical protein
MIRITPNVFPLFRVVLFVLSLFLSVVPWFCVIFLFWLLCIYLITIARVAQ